MNGVSAYTVDLLPNSQQAVVDSAINPNFSNDSTSNDPESFVNQSSPTWVLTFIRFENRDTFRNNNNSALEVKQNDPLVIESDCIAVTTGMNKGTLTPSMEATFKETDVNYLTAVAPGDFVFVNILNWESDARRVAQNARNGSPINGPDDGFKGLYKIQRVSKNISINEQSGTKQVIYKIDGYGFTEFNNTIYFNQNLLASGSESNFGIFIRKLSSDWAQLANSKGYFQLRDIVALLITSFIGNGINTTNYSDDFKAFLPTANTQFLIPALVGKLMGISNAKAAKDIYNYNFGVQGYSGSSNQTMAQGLNPKFNSNFSGPGFHFTPTQLQGLSFFMPEYWNSVKAWSILNQYTNAPLNEIFTCYKLGTDNKIYPTVVFRQIPFTTQDFKARTNVTIPVTQFLTIPRWKVDSALVYSYDIGRDEVARINFYQYYSRAAINDKQGSGPAQEVGAGNYAFDSEDVTRSGLRPSIVSNMFDPYVQTGPLSPSWAKIMGDATIGGQLKLNGTIEMLGVSQPICIGDNLQFEGVVFHIESIIHSCNIDPSSGIKRFKTTLKLSQGVALDSPSSVTQYSEMTNTSGYLDRQNDYNNLDQILPGVSESQDVLDRSNNIDIDPSQIKNFPFPQPTDPES